MVPFQTAYPSELSRIVFAATLTFSRVSDIFYDVMHLGWQHCFCEYPRALVNT